MFTTVACDSGTSRSRTDNRTDDCTTDDDYTTDKET